MDDKQEQKFHQMTETPVGSLICRLALPCILSMLVTSFYNMADTFFVGMLKNDSVTGAVGAAHAGWRGTAADIAGETVRTMQDAFGCNPADIRAAIGPNIGFCHFETGADVPQAMLAAFGSGVEPFIRPAGEKYYVNLKEINRFALNRAGVSSVDVSTDCTMCSTHRFWSHRATQGVRGAQGAVIQCKEVRP